MEKKFLKWCRKLIPDRNRPLSNSNGQPSKVSSGFSVDSQINFPYPEVLDNMEKEVPIEDPKLEKEQNVETGIQEHDSLCASKYEIFKIQKHSSSLRVEHNFNNTGDLKCDGADVGLSCTVPLKTLRRSTENVDIVGLNLQKFEVNDCSPNETCTIVEKSTDLVVCRDCETEFCDRSQSDLCIFAGMSEEEMLIIRNEVEIQLNRMCPISYYDFCVIACDVDYQDAMLFRTNFCKEYYLKGCMLFDSDISSLGGDIFEQYEAMIERSTKVFFYHTENYKKDYVHLRVQNGAVYQQLWEQMQRNREKCVPVFPHGRHKLGLALSGVSGLDASIPDSFKHRVTATFTENVRNVRILKQIDAQKKRQILYKEVLKNIIQKHKSDIIMMKKDPRSDHLLHMNEEFDSSLSGNIKPVLLAENIKKEIHEVISETIQSSNVNNDTFQQMPLNSYDVNISKSSEVHIGPRIEVNVNINTSENNIVCQDTDFDSSEECD